MTMDYPAICRACAHRLTFSTCKAYPVAIPTNILVDGVDHRKSLPGDHGVTFLQDPDKTAEFQDWLAIYGP